MYCRKSTDSEDRQVQSIEDQRREINKLVKDRNLNIVKTFGESKSAKQPGRTSFNEMITMIQQGKADGIICWKLNRLARNPIDGGNIQWLLQKGVIKSIITPSREYLPTDNILMMTVELGMANQDILDLSKDVKRGMISKAKKGWRPCTAPLGYLNDKAGDKGNKRIFKDEERFPLVKKMWELLLTGSYSVPQILEVANNKWGLRTREGKKFTKTPLYKLFRNPFYYGEFTWGGEVYQGEHEAMITPEEFDKAQKLLGKYGRPRPRTKRLPFTGVIRCEECGCMITADEKLKKIKSTGEMKRYIYHRCGKSKKNHPCHQKPIKHDDLKKQINKYLDSITIPNEFLGWAIEVLRSNNKLEEKNRDKTLKNHRKNYDFVLKQVDNLINAYISPDNVDRELISEEEFKSKKSTLVKEKAGIEAETRKVEQGVNQWLKLTEQTFNFATYAKVWFEKGDYERKTHILQALGQNFWLKDGKLTVELHKPLLVLKKGLENEVLEKAMLEPGILHSTKQKSSRFATVFSHWSGQGESNPHHQLGKLR